MATKKKDTAYAANTIDLGVLNNWYQFCDLSNRKMHWDYFVIDQFLRGNHNIRGNPSDNTLVVGATKLESVFYPINKIYSTFRSVRGFVTRHRPKVEVEPSSTSDDSVTYSRQANLILERDNLLNNYRKINKEWAYYGIKYGVGYRQISYDPVRKCCLRWSIDPFDLLIGSRYGEMEDAPYIIKTYTRTVGYLQNKYPEKKDEIVADDLLAADLYKRLSLQMKFLNSGIYPGNRMEERTCVVKECWYHTFDKNSLGGTVSKKVFIASAILDEEDTPFDDYPFVAYKADIVPNEASGEGHLKHIIAPQRMLNLLNTQMLEYNHLVNRGRFLVPKNSGFQVINTKEGQVIRYNPGKKPEVLNPPGINPMLENQLNLASTFIEDIGGQHDASNGNVPARVYSGDAIEALQAGDSNNISDLRDNFEDALAQEAAWVLRMYSLFEKDGIVINKKQSNGTNVSFAAMGAEAHSRTGSTPPDKYYVEENGSYCEVCTVLTDNNVKVSVVSELGETQAARLNLLLKLVENGLPINVMLKLIEFPNTEDVMQRIAEEAAGDIMKQNLLNATQQQGAMPQGQPSEQSQAGGTPPPEQLGPVISQLEQALGGSSSGGGYG